MCRDLRAEGNWTPILMLTAKDGEYDEAEALDTGADDFLSKPFSFVVLVARLRALAPARVDRRGRRSLSARRPRARPGRSRVPPRRRRRSRSRRASSRCSSTSCAAPATSCRKPELLDEVWGPDFDGDPNVVEVYVGYLRRKVDAPFDRRSIVTVRGAGYRVVDDAG